MLSFSNSFEFASLSTRGPNFLLNVLRLKSQVGMNAVFEIILSILGSF